MRASTHPTGHRDHNCHDRKAEYGSSNKNNAVSAISRSGLSQTDLPRLRRNESFILNIHIRAESWEEGEELCRQESPLAPLPHLLLPTCPHYRARPPCLQQAQGRPLHKRSGGESCLLLHQPKAGQPNRPCDSRPPPGFRHGSARNFWV